MQPLPDGQCQEAESKLMSIILLSMVAILSPARSLFLTSAWIQAMFSFISDFSFQGNILVRYQEVPTTHLAIQAVSPFQRITPKPLISACLP